MIEWIYWIGFSVTTVLFGWLGWKARDRIDPDDMIIAPLAAGFFWPLLAILLVISYVVNVVSRGK